jgi:hypothetical protein
MAEPKTQRNDNSVEDFLNGIADERKRRDAFAIAALMQKATKAKPQMWGSSIVGFGTYRLKYASGREADWPLVAFSPRKQNLTLYISSGFEGRSALLKKLGKHSTGKACLYIKSLDDVDVPTLREMIRRSVAHTRKTHK